MAQQTIVGKLMIHLLTRYRGYLSGRSLLEKSKNISGVDLDVFFSENSTRMFEPLALLDQTNYPTRKTRSGAVTSVYRYSSVGAGCISAFHALSQFTRRSVYALTCWNVEQCGAGIVCESYRLYTMMRCICYKLVIVVGADMLLLEHTSSRSQRRLNPAMECFQPSMTVSLKQPPVISQFGLVAVGGRTVLRGRFSQA
ncbi:hypothetical protein L218DRAFT_126930 [Marasmius fiardii PR-910]|nr:hypothetical protein L218DRAFT_126930 [Marasmius fiardii PR-910]